MIMKNLKPALIALGVIIAVPLGLGLGSAAAQQTTSGNSASIDAFDEIIARAVGPLAVGPANVGILGGYFQAQMDAFLTANGHTVSIETAGTIAGGSLDGLDALYLNRGGAGAAAAVIPEIEAFVNGGGILITEFSATGLLLDGTFSFFDVAVLDNIFVPSGTFCGGNDIVIVSPTNGVATGLPGAWSCSGDPIGVFQVYDALTLDSDIEIVATLRGIDSNDDGEDDPVVGTSCIGGGAVVAYFTDFGDWQPLEQPRICNGSASCMRSIQDEALMLNSVTVALDSCLIDVMIDIKFLSNPNAYNCKKKGVLPLTIFGMDNLDVNDINIGSLRLSREDGAGSDVGPPVSWSFADRGDPDTDKGASEGAIVDGVEQDYLNPDGLLDLDVAFVSRDVAVLIDCENLSKNDISETLVLTGELDNGRLLASIPVGDPGIDQLVIKNK